MRGIDFFMGVLFVKAAHSSERSRFRRFVLLQAHDSIIILVPRGNELSQSHKEIYAKQKRECLSYEKQLAMRGEIRGGGGFMR